MPRINARGQFTIRVNFFDDFSRLGLLRSFSFRVPVSGSVGSERF